MCGESPDRRFSEALVIGVDQSASNGQPHQGRNVTDLQFGHQTAAIGGNRLGRQMQLFANFRAGISLDHHEDRFPPDPTRRPFGVITVSEFSRRETVEALWHRPGSDRHRPERRRSGLRSDGPRAEGEYILAVGTLEPRKNLARSDRSRGPGRLRAPDRRSEGVGWRRSEWGRRSLARPSLALSWRSSTVSARFWATLALRRVRDPGCRGDGVRDARRDEPRQRHGRRRGSAACSSIPMTPDRSQQGSTRRCVDATSSWYQALLGPRPTRGRERPRRPWQRMRRRCHERAVGRRRR